MLLADVVVAMQHNIAVHGGPSLITTPAQGQSRAFLPPDERTRRIVWPFIVMTSERMLIQVSATPRDACADTNIHTAAYVHGI